MKIPRRTHGPGQRRARYGRRALFFLLVGLVAVMWLRGYLERRAEEARAQAALEHQALPGDGATHRIVEISGMVHHPGVYRLEPGQSLGDLMDRARAFPAEGASLPALWRPIALESGQSVRIAWGESGPMLSMGAMPADTRLLFGIPLSLNEASAEELTAIPGIGPSLGAAIVEERTRRGGFRSLDEILEVSGVGPAKVEALADHVVIEAPPAETEAP